MGTPVAHHKNGSASIADRLDAHRDTIARLCEMRIRRELPSARPHDVPTLLNHIPQFIDAMASRLRGKPVHAPESMEEKRISRYHGTQRAGLASYTLENILAEYRLMRKAVFEVLERDGPLKSEDRDAILDTIQLGAKSAAVQFLHTRTTQMKILQWLPASRTGKCCVSIATVLVAAAVQWLLSPYLANTPFICFYPAVVIACLFGDGVIASVLSALVAQYVFVQPAFSFKFEFPHHAVHLGIFLFNAFLITTVTNTMRKAKFRADILANEQAKAKHDLEESESRFRELADSIPQLAWSADKTGMITWFNKRWYEYTGMNPDELVGFGWLDKVHDPDYKNQSHSRYEEHIKNGREWEDVIPLRGKDGEWRWFLSRARPIRGPSGKIARWFGTNTDITELREARNEIKQANERYELALSAGKIGVWELDINSPRIRWSPRQFEIFDVDPKTDPLTYDVFLSRVHPEDHEKVSKEYEAAVKEKRDFRLTYRAVWRDGSVHWVKADGRIYYNMDGKPVRMNGTNIDVTDRVLADIVIKKSESEFRALAESMPQIVWTADKEGKIEYFNRRFFNYTDLPFEEAKGFGWEKIVHPDDLPAVRACWKDALEKEHVYQMEYRIRRNDGEYRWHLGRSEPIRDENGYVMKWYGTNTEIHDYKLLISALEEEQRLRERFTNMLAHDLKNPLSAAKFSAQLALRGKSDKSTSEKSFHRIVGSIDRADKMISDLLDASRIKAGERLPLEIESIKLAPLLAHMIEDQALIHGDRFRLHAVGALQGYWSSEALRRVFENLVGNAVKYGSPDTPITVTARENHHHVLVEVHNFGGELSASDVQHLFTMFRRAKHAESSGKLGWGIGLTLVKGIVEAHGGRTWVESGSGKGTSFFVDLPKDSRPFVLGKDHNHGIPKPNKET